MDWLAQNWIWVVGALVIVLIVYFVTRKPGSKKLSERDAERIFSALVAALENAVDDTIGQHYTRQDRQKIAMGMIAVMATDEIPLERLISNKILFAAVMAKSVAALTSAGEISAR